MRWAKEKGNGTVARALVIAVTFLVSAVHNPKRFCLSQVLRSIGLLAIVFFYTLSIKNAGKNLSVEHKKLSIFYIIIKREYALVILLTNFYYIIVCFGYLQYYNIEL